MADGVSDGNEDDSEEAELEVSEEEGRPWKGLARFVGTSH